MDAERTITGPLDVKHGTVNAYVSHGCRCQPCRDAKAAYYRADDLARNKARRELARRHKDEYIALVENFKREAS